MEYISIREMANMWGISPRRVQVLCAKGRIPGATHIGYTWAIPKNSEKPKDARIRSGKYCNKAQKKME